MGWNFRKSIKILPGVRLNFGKRGFTSTTVGGRWFKTNFSSKGVRQTVSLPGTGLSYSSTTPTGQRRTHSGAIVPQTLPPIWFCPMCGFENVHGQQTCSYCKFFNEAYQPHLFQYRSSPASNASNWIAGLGGGGALLAVIGVCAFCGLISSSSNPSSNSATPKPAPLRTIAATPTPVIVATPTPKRGKNKGKNKPAEVSNSESPSYSTVPTYPVYSAPRQPRSNGLIRGPRGGCYYINSRGNKTYVDRSMCN